MVRCVNKLVMESNDGGTGLADDDNASPVLVRWTVKKPGTTTPPKSDDYTTWTVKQLRKECTSRKIRVSRKPYPEDRIKRLVEFDEYHLSLIANTVDSLPIARRSASIRAKNCCARLLTMLFSDAHATKFAQTGGKLTRQQLDARETHANSVFWRDITTDFNTNPTDYNHLVSASARLAALDPSVIVEHSAVELYDVWKTVLQKYQRALANFTKSGEHDDDFFGHCPGSLDVFYLRECLEIKHDLTSFVEGGMLQEDQFDSLKRRFDSSSATQSPSSKKVKQEMMQTMKSITSKLLGSSTSSVDSILKMHQLIEHVEGRLEAMKEKGKSDMGLKKSATVYREKLLEMESKLCNEG